MTRSAHDKSATRLALIGAAGRIRRAVDRLITPRATRIPDDGTTGDAVIEPGSFGVVHASTRYESVVPMIPGAAGVVFGNLLHEGNNIVMRGPRDRCTGVFAFGGTEIASAWRTLARNTRGVFVLRDSLFSQQDHPFGNDPYAPLLPPSYVLVLAESAMTGRPIRVPELPAVDDRVWRRLRRPTEVFGDLPVSHLLYRAAVAKGPAARNARHTLHRMFDDVRDVVAAIPSGAHSVAALGAERIAASDRAYFTAALRRDRVIPIFVENPMPHERGEMKGIDIVGRDVDPALRDMVVRTIYARRLADGDLAVERYDLSDASERRRAVALLQALVPRSSVGVATTRVWLWVTGRLSSGGKLAGENALAHVRGFRAELERANVDIARVALFSKPAYEPPETGFCTDMESALAAHEALGIPLSVAVSTMDKRLFGLLCPQGRQVPEPHPTE